MQMDHYTHVCHIFTMPYKCFSDVAFVNGAPPAIGNTSWNMIINADALFWMVE